MKQASIVSEPEHIGFALVVLDPSGTKVLLGQRINVFRAGMYGLPGGRLELVEALEAGARRELEEETGVSADSVKYIGTVREFLQTYNFIHFVYQVTAYSGEIQNMEPEKCAGWDWHSLDSLPEMMPGHALVLELYKNKRALLDSVER